ncbi:hypothetical protein ACWC0C_42125 [Streptomyces sp. NPDC001709]
MLDLLNVLKNADFRTGFTDEFSSVAAYERIDRATTAATPAFRYRSGGRTSPEAGR